VSREHNPWLKNFGRDRYTYHNELYTINADYWNKNEARIAHGYPGTYFVQAALIYGVGLYTAKEQGIVKKGVLFSRFWRAHYFDWITFGRRAGVYGVVGGLLAGTILFGSPDLSIARVNSKFNYYCMRPTLDNDGNRTLYLPRMN